MNSQISVMVHGAVTIAGLHNKQKNSTNVATMTVAGVDDPVAAELTKLRFGRTWFLQEYTGYQTKIYLVGR